MSVPSDRLLDVVGVGMVIPSPARSAPLPDVAAVARHAEEVGLDGVWAGDHLAIGGLPLLDAPLTLAAAAAVTARISIGTAILVPSLRPLVWAAKQVATLVQIAGADRVQLGVGVGAGPATEWAAAGRDHAQRGRRTDEFLATLPWLLAGRPTSITDAAAAGPVSLAPVVAMPTVWIGGELIAALRRVVRFGDGWLAGLLTAPEYGAGVRRLADLADEAARSLPRLAVVVHAGVGRSPTLRDRTVQAVAAAYGLSDDRAAALAVTGTPSEVAEQLAAYIELGVEHIAVISEVTGWDEATTLLAETRRLLNW
jgi:alkanesulfonate monooxygenase SsuD/methylene tetrahydromethanopterin reductase-like flavin-dependent oxidoreductase (luciferase family)